MKKIFSRGLSLLLVLVMVLGMVPAAMAAEGDPTVILSANKTTCYEDDPVKVTVTVGNVPEGYELTKVIGKPLDVEYTIKSDGITAEYTYTQHKPADTYELQAQATFTYTGEDTTKPAELKVLSNKVDLTVTAAPVYATAIAFENPETQMGVGGTQNLKVVAVAPSADAIVPTDLVWTSNNSTKVSVNRQGKVSAKAITNTNEVVTITAKSEADPDIKATVDITVGKLELGFALNESSESFILAPGETAQISGHYTPNDSYESFVKLSFESDDKSVATVSTAGKITAKGKGDAIITVTATLNRNTDGYKNYQLDGGATSLKKYVNVTVLNKYRVDCENNEGAVNSGVSLNPVLYDGNGKKVPNAEFDAEITGIGTLNRTTGKSFTASSRDCGVAAVTFTAVGVDNDGADVSKTVYVGFYDKAELEVNIRDGLSTFKFNDDYIASSAECNNTKLYNISDYTMVELLATALYDVPSGVGHYEFSINGGSGGELNAPVGESWTSSKTVRAGSLGEVSFVQLSQTNEVTTFTVNAKYGSAGSESAVTVGKAVVTINCGSSAAVEYETTYNKSITFDSKDFEDYWNDQRSSSYSKLDYVVFGVSNTIPKEGYLYVDSNKGAEVDAYTKFASVASGTKKDLDYVTYVPNASITSAYTIEIPFVAYGTNSDSASGYVVITLNSKGNSIGVRGTALGTSVAKAISEAYYTATGQTMGYVTFDGLAAEKGTLYTDLPYEGGYERVTYADKVTTVDYFYYNATGGYTGARKELAKVTVIPAADYTGDLKIGYTAYNESGRESYRGTLTYTVQAPTVSTKFTDVKASSYSWASGAVDFLYEEGVAAGDKGKYLPGNNITRGDFMLMLYRAFLKKDYDTQTVTSNFKDMVEGTSDYSKETYKAVGIAKQLGIAQGTNDKFNPKDNITREEAMALIYRTLDKLDRDLRYTSGVSASSMKDYSKVSSWATTAISSLISHGVVKGNNDNIKPKDNIKRAEMACILHRVITY